MLRRGIALTLGVLGNIGSHARDSELITRIQRILSPRQLPEGNTLRPLTASVLAVAIGLCVLLARSPRWIEFGASPTVTTVASTAPAAEAATDVAAARPITAGYRPMLVKAEMPAPRVRDLQVRPIRMKSIGENAEPVRMRSLPPHRTLRVAERSPEWRTQQDFAEPGLTLVSTRDSQTLYAAVPWQGGWLLFQL
jgi:hypothetical protein